MSTFFITFYVSYVFCNIWFKCSYFTDCLRLQVAIKDFSDFFNTLFDTCYTVFTAWKWYYWSIFFNLKLTRAEVVLRCSYTKCLPKKFCIFDNCLIILFPSWFSNCEISQVVFFLVLFSSWHIALRTSNIWTTSNASVSVLITVLILG